MSGTYLFELPFGPDKFWVTTGVGSHILEGFSISGTFNFATGAWLSPGFEPTAQSVECGNTSGLRPNPDRTIGRLPAAVRCAVVQHRGLLSAQQYAGILRLLRQRSAQLD